MSIHIPEDLPQLEPKLASVLANCSSAHRYAGEAIAAHVKRFWDEDEQGVPSQTADTLQTKLGPSFDAVLKDQTRDETEAAVNSLVDTWEQIRPTLKTA